MCKQSNQRNGNNEKFQTFCKSYDTQKIKDLFFFFFLLIKNLFTNLFDKSITILAIGGLVHPYTA